MLNLQSDQLKNWKSHLENKMSKQAFSQLGIGCPFCCLILQANCHQVKVLRSH